MAVMAIRTVKHSTGERVPLLFNAGADYQPLFFPLMWVTLSRRSKARQSIEKDLASLRAFYSYCGQSGFDVEAAIANMDFDLILERYDRFGTWIKTREKHTWSKRRTAGAGQVGHGCYLGPRAINGYLWSVRMFIEWCIRRYFSPQRQVIDRIDEVLWRRDLIVKELYRICLDHSMRGGSSDGDECAGLERDEIEKLRALTAPNNPLNPYGVDQRFRNWAILNLLAETGMRLSDMLNLQTADHQEVNGRYFINILDRTDDPSDSRRSEPGFKTLERTVEISSELYDILNDYIDFHRRPVRNGHPVKLTHKYLLTNKHGDPLGAVSVSRVFEPLKSLLNSPTLSAHALRHTFANNFLEFLVDRQGVPLDAALDQLRYLGGWSATSKMPQRYGRRYTARLANRMNRQRVESAWERARHYEKRS